MSKTTTNLLGLLITILAGIYFFVTYCSECNKDKGADFTLEREKEVVSTPTVLEVTSYPFAFSDGDFSYNVKDNFNYNVSSSSFLEPLSQKVRDGIIPGLKNFLTENENKVINITGFYRHNENNNSAFPNLGLARANDIKNFFVSQEIPSPQINTMGKLKDDMVPKGNLLYGPLAFEIGDVATELDTELSDLYDNIKADPLVLYFSTGEASITLNSEQRQKIADISRYLDKVKGAKCEIIGYTDNVGRRKTNVKLGLERANFVKIYLLENGIPENKIKTDSKGHRDPIANNTMEEGRAKNRRTVITLSK